MLLDLTYARAQGAALFLGLPHSWLQCASLVWFLLTFTGQMLSLFLCIALCYTGNPVIIAALCLYYAYIWTAGYHVAETAANMDKCPVRRWELWRHFADFFQGKLVKTADLDPSKNYVFSCHPHGICCYSVWMNFATEATGWSTKFAGIKPHCMTLAGNFKFALIREYVLAAGLRVASRKACVNVLKSGPGNSVVLTVGGAAESLLIEPGTYNLVLNKRKGFVRVALEAGAALVPVICFGETGTYSSYTPPEGSLSHKIQRRWQKTMHFGFPLAWGEGLITRWGLLPHRVPLSTVVGPPLELPRWEGPCRGEEFDKAVEAAHARYVCALQELWDSHKDKFAPDRKGEMTLVE